MSDQEQTRTDTRQLQVVNPMGLWAPWTDSYLKKGVKPPKDDKKTWRPLFQQL